MNKSNHTKGYWSCILNDRFFSLNTTATRGEVYTAGSACKNITCPQECSLTTKSTFLLLPRLDSGRNDDWTWNAFWSESYSRWRITVKFSPDILCPWLSQGVSGDRVSDANFPMGPLWELPCVPCVLIGLATVWVERFSNLASYVIFFKRPIP